eukprot:c27082_g1_i1 orf=1589-2761(+)
MNMPDDNAISFEEKISEHMPSGSNLERDILPIREDERVRFDNSAEDEEDSVSHEKHGNIMSVVSFVHQEDDALDVCRVCHCTEPDQKGEAALKFLAISYPYFSNFRESAHACDSAFKDGRRFEGAVNGAPDGVSGCARCGSRNDLELGRCVCSVGSLINLGCACKNDLALAHYACALRWFVSRGSILCEICGEPAVNVSHLDQSKVIAALKERHRVQNVAVGSSEVGIFDRHDSRTDVVTENSVSDVAATSIDQLLEATSWFDPHGNAMSGLQVSNTEQIVNIPGEELLSSVSPTTKWAVEGTGILIATGLLTVTIIWLLAPRVGKGVAKRVLNVFLGGLCALSIVTFLRFGVLPRIKYGPARYWAILLVFWFLVFGVWASSTRSTRSSG